MEVVTVVVEVEVAVRRSRPADWTVSGVRQYTDYQAKGPPS
jgi:hypothetical protein